MKLFKLLPILFFAFSLNFLVSCSSDDSTTAIEETPVVGEEIIDGEEPEVTEEEEEPEVVVEEPEEPEEEVVVEEPEVTEEEPEVIDLNTSNLSERYMFNGNIVIENSYNTGGCESPPCDTIDESLVGIFDNQVPDDNYFRLSEDGSELNLECQLEKGRRIEFKQRSEGPLTSFSELALEGVYYDIPNNGVTIAQVHNRGASSGNKPFFRLVLHKDGLETVLRKDPVVSSSDTSFLKEDYSFLNNEDYDLSPLKVVIGKSDGMVHINVEQNGAVILDESFVPDPSTDWVNDTGISNGYYLKAGLYNDDGPHTKNLVVGYSTVIFNTDDN